MSNVINTVNTAVCYLWKVVKKVNNQVLSQEKNFFMFLRFVCIRDDACSLSFVIAFKDNVKPNHYAP